MKLLGQCGRPRSLTESGCERTGSGTTGHTYPFLKEDSDAKGLLPIPCTKEKFDKEVKWSVGCRALLQLSETYSSHSTKKLLISGSWLSVKHKPLSIVFKFRHSSPHLQGFAKWVCPYKTFAIHFSILFHSISSDSKGSPFWTPFQPPPRAISHCPVMPHQGCSPAVAGIETDCLNLPWQ